MAEWNQVHSEDCRQTTILTKDIYFSLYSRSRGNRRAVAAGTVILSVSRDVVRYEPRDPALRSPTAMNGRPKSNGRPSTRQMMDKTVPSDSPPSGAESRRPGYVNSRRQATASFHSCCCCCTAALGHPPVELPIDCPSAAVRHRTLSQKSIARQTVVRLANERPSGSPPRPPPRPPPLDNTIAHPVTLTELIFFM
jgi:hypothetical protein